MRYIITEYNKHTGELLNTFPVEEGVAHIYNLDGEMRLGKFLTDREVYKSLLEGCSIVLGKYEYFVEAAS